MKNCPTNNRVQLNKMPAQFKKISVKKNFLIENSKEYSYNMAHSKLGNLNIEESKTSRLIQ